MPHQHTGDNIVTRAINWLRRGYPQGVPSHDNIAVLYVLKRHLSNEDIEAVIKEMIDASPQDSPTRRFTDKQIRDYIRDSAHQVPNPEDIERVKTRLTESGFPVE